MKYSVKTIDREYTPAEAATVSGVSTTLQRDWRRRGVLPGRKDAKRASFKVGDLIEMTVMRAFTQSGISLETAEHISRLAVLPVLDDLSRWEDVAVFTGDPLSPEQMDRIRAGAVRGASAEEQFSFVALPETDGQVSAARLTNLADGEQIMAKGGNFYGIVLDHYRLAHRIAELSPRPIFRFHVTHLPNEGEDG